MQALIDARTLSKLKWRCRRGLLENDLFIERFFTRHEKSLTTEHAKALQVLMDLGDNDLLDLLLARAEPDGTLDRPDVHAVLRLMRMPPPDRAHFQDFDHSKERA
jgi:antitoxin CptB